MKTVWFFGRSGAGKSTLSDALRKQILLLGSSCQVFDGDELRKTINKNLGFSKQDRIIAVERTVSYISKTNGCDYQIVSMITPFCESQQLVKEKFGDDVLFVFLDCPVDTCAERDVKGLYAKNPAGLLDFEPPKLYDLRLDSENLSVDHCCRLVVQLLCAD